MASLSSLNFRLTANIAPFRKGLNKAERSMDKFGRNMQRTGKNLSMKLTAPLAALGAMSFNVFRDFELEMAKVKAVSGATADEFKALSDNAKELGRSTIFSAREVAGLQLEFAKLGFTAKQITGVTEATLNLAQASGSDLARSAEVAGATLRGFGLDVSETGRVTDVMAKSFSTSSMDMESFAEGMKMVAPIAKSAGMSLEETTAMMSLLANAGVKGSMAGTQLRRIISELATTGKPTTEAIRDLAESGLTLVDAKDEVGRAAQGALTILAGSVDQINPMTEALKNSSGAAEEMADIMDMTAAGASKALGSAVEGLAIEFGGLISVALTPVIKKLTQFATFVNELPKGMKIFVAVVAALAAGIGPLIFVAGSLVRVMTALRAATILQTIATGALGVAVQIATSPITLIAIAIFALGAAFIYVRENSEAFAAGLRNAFRDLANFVLPLINTIINAVNKVASALGRDSVLIEPFEKFQREEQPILKSFREVFGGVARSIGLIKDKSEETTESLGTLAEGIDGVTESANNGTRALTEYEKMVKRVNAISDKRAQFNVNLDVTDTEFEPLPYDEEETDEKFLKLETNYARIKVAAMEMADKVTQAVNRMAVDTIVGMADIAGAMAVGEASFADMGKFIIGQFATILSQLGQMFIEYGIALMGFQAASISMNPALAIAAGAALVAVAGGIKAHMSKMGEGGIPALAEGGIVTGPTLALIGEGRESEAVIPLSKLNTMMQGGGGQNVVVTGRISGADILLSNERASRNRTRQRGF
ncbi:phage tail tape measure protein [Schleiferiaceae bacterium]|nr:phage tail tape measure protein [Schleiferiaceae bacterium]